ncbi:MAG: hypothetical protein A2383_02255 [Candidatus Pacebacteria bacterium RIFOXYB1_FULL_39_46]|nr:MAG: hypothetical protein A2383_02255 [Candidatus Pacebacteria bacterium RIFOXYB1_FULL_39_46]OGJ39112.1 MAG: hypothetical protein A2182_02195 [Candidatus Pacebacteria bacterium RIFOXYA1_FULL_38_18]OGJ40188.1 MAG: hypothetical protein A2582_03810 [Candidatus Pacebacteria bacterium RIFOXYD1_FULL_39_27]OGJ41071.1 MAG: hypothetical protein A2411_01155 [Candidatus Pacebacteria bacterium RIFOXYC1_FULL_39_21]
MRLGRLLGISPTEVIVSLIATTLVFSPLAYAAASADVTATVTIASISLTVTDGSVTYGTINTSSSTDTTTNGVNDSQTTTNNGNVTEDFDIKAQDSSNWTLSSTAGSETFAHKFCITDCDTSPTWTALTASYQALATSVTESGTQVFDLQFLSPTATVVTAEESLTVTVLASAS